MSYPLSFAEECGPRALAIVLDITPEQAAELLWPARQLWQEARRARPTGSGVFGTSERALQDILVRVGAGVDVFDGRGRLIADKDVLLTLLRRQAHERAVTVQRAPRRAPPKENGTGADPVSDPVAASPPSWLEDLDTLEAWLARHAAGRWLYSLTNGVEAHVVAAYGPYTLIGDPEGSYQTWKVYEAALVHPPNSLNLQGMTDAEN